MSTHRWSKPSSGMTDIALDTDLESVVAALAAADRVLVATHENPDGDAIGSMSAAAGALRSWASTCAPTSSPSRRIPHEVSFLDTEGLERRIDPASLAGWTLLALDCGNERRLGGQYADLLARLPPVIDVDHHHDNSRFGGVNLVDGGASSTAEILARIFDGLGVELTPADRRGPLRRPGHRHRPLPVPHHQPRRAAPGRAPGRGRRRRAQGVRARVREHAVRQAAAAGPRDRERRAPTSDGRLLDLARHPRRPAPSGGRRGHHRGTDRQSARQSRACRSPA